MLEKLRLWKALRCEIAAGEVPPPPPLRSRMLGAAPWIWGLLQAGASYKGEFEKRLRQVIDEVLREACDSVHDEAHTLIEPAVWPAPVTPPICLKPALARGTLRTIAATRGTGLSTKIYQKDPALTAVSR